MRSYLPTSPEDIAARTQVSRQIYLWLDEPADWELRVRQLRISGWCVAKRGEPLTAIRARLRGKTFASRFDRARPEVPAHVDLPNAPVLCGFAFDVRVPFGKGRFELQVARADGKWIKAFARDIWGPLRISAQERALRRRISDADTRVHHPFFIDRPAEEDWNLPRRHLHISGWYFAKGGEEIVELRARVRRKIFRANYGIVRPDVAASHETGLEGLRSGFSLDVTVPPGPSTLVLEARSRGGPWHQFLVRPVRGILLGRTRVEEEEAVGNYAEWIRLYDSITKADEEKIRQHIARFAQKPTFSVLLPVYNTDARWLKRAINSVRGQLYPNWELCLVDDASTAPHVPKLVAQCARKETRLKIHRRAENGHISAASNDALRMASGDYMALLDHDDELAPTALYFAALELNRRPDLQLLYSDEDKLDKQGRRTDPYFKSDWNPDLLFAQNYISHLSIYAADLVRKVGGFREGFEGSQDYDLTLRCIEQIAPEQIHHIPHVLYHWRIAEESTATFAAAKPYAHEAAVRAVQEHLNRRGIAARVETHYANYQRVRYAPPPEKPLVSIIIPTRDRAALLRQCLESIRSKTTYRNFEIILLDNESRESLDVEADRIVRVDGDFNYSRLNNIGVAAAKGQFIALLNNDLEITHPDWLTEMISHAARPEIGAVGARLRYPDGRIQHGGVILGVGGVATHAHHGLRSEHGYFARAHLTQNFSAVTAACMVLRKSVYEELGGLDEVNLAVAFNDVDFCLRLREAGLRVVWTPHAELIHHESASRGLEDTRLKQRRFLDEVAYMQKKWGHILRADPFYHPNLSIESNQQFKLAFPPRVSKPWKSET